MSRPAGRRLDARARYRERGDMRAPWLGLACAALVACGETGSDPLQATPVPNDLQIVGFELPSDLSWTSTTCTFPVERPRIASRPLQLRVADDVWLPRDESPPAAASPHRSVPIRVERTSLGEGVGAGARTFGLQRATVRWRCGDGISVYDRNDWPSLGIEPDWPVHPLELPGLDKPFCGLDLEGVTEFELQVAPLELGPEQRGTAWVEILSPPDRRRFFNYLEFLRLGSLCQPGFLPPDRPLREHNPPHCANALDAIPRLFGMPAAEWSGHGALFRYAVRVDDGRFAVNPNITLYFADEFGIEYPVSAELQTRLQFFGIEEPQPGYRLCYERPLSEIER